MSEKVIDARAGDRAHAQLREWGYEVRGEATRPTHGVTYGVSSCDAMPNGTVIETTYSLPIGYATFTALPESRVREIVREELAAQAKAPPPPDVDPDFNGKEAVAPKPTAERLLADLVEAWNATYPLEAKLPESVLPFVNSPALAAARGYLAREYFASTKGMVK